MSLKKRIYSIVCTGVLLTQSAVSFADFNPNKFYEIRPLGHEKVWDVSGGGSAKDGAQVILWDRHDGDNQKFHFQQTEYGSWVIRPKTHMHAPHTLSIAGEIEEIGVKLILREQKLTGSPLRLTTKKYQEFTLTRVGGSLYRIQNLRSGLSLCFDKHGDLMQSLDYTADSIVELIESGYFISKPDKRIGNYGWQFYRE